MNFDFPRCPHCQNNIDENHDFIKCALAMKHNCNKKYWMEVNEDTYGKWMVEVKCNSDTLVCYGQIYSQDDAHLVGEAFIDGIKLIEGE